MRYFQHDVAASKNKPWQGQGHVDLFLKKNSLSNKTNETPKPPKPFLSSPLCVPLVLFFLLRDETSPKRGQRMLTFTRRSREKEKRHLTKKSARVVFLNWALFIPREFSHIRVSHDHVSVKNTCRTLSTANDHIHFFPRHLFATFVFDSEKHSSLFILPSLARAFSGEECVRTAKDFNSQQN